MKIAVLSDIHDNLWNLARALEHARTAEVLICCGDLCSPFVIAQLAKFAGDVHVVFGNNDADLFRITQNAARFPNIKLHGEFFAAEFAGRRLAVQHFDAIARPLAQGGGYDVVCFGHNHEVELGRVGECVVINPGAVMGAKFPGGNWQDTKPTIAVYDAEKHSAEIVEI